jgi:hypothetical protein
MNRMPRFAPAILVVILSLVLLLSCERGEPSVVETRLMREMTREVDDNGTDQESILTETSRPNDPAAEASPASPLWYEEAPSTTAGFRLWEWRFHDVSRAINPGGELYEARVAGEPVRVLQYWVYFEDVDPQNRGARWLDPRGV